MRIFRKKVVNKPINSNTEEAEAVQLWVVKWVSRYGKFSTDTKDEFEAFTSKELAESFASDLREAFKFIKHTSQTEAVVTKG